MAYLTENKLRIVWGCPPFFETSKWTFSRIYRRYRQKVGLPASAPFIQWVEQRFFPSKMVMLVNCPGSPVIFETLPRSSDHRFAREFPWFPKGFTFDPGGFRGSGFPPSRSMVSRLISREARRNIWGFHEPSSRFCSRTGNRSCGETKTANSSGM